MEKIIYDSLTNKIEKYISLENEIIDKTIQESIFFDTEEFHELHEKNAEKLIKIYFKNGKKINSFIYIGIRNDIGYVPYSSPFSNLHTKLNFRAEEIKTIVNNLKNIVRELKLKELNISFPPYIYDNSIEEKINIFLSEGFRIKYIDINNYFNLLEEIIQDRAVKKDFNNNIKNNLNFEENDLEIAYQVIKKNREARGFPLKMTLDHIKNIEKLKNAKVDTFYVTYNEIPIASAIVFEVLPLKKQVVYWGNDTDFHEIKPMAFLVNKLLEYYKNEGIKILDIGPSSEVGKINYGLLQFKKNIGCKSCLKYTLRYENTNI